MKEIREIGIEKEVFLMQGNKIKEPAKYGFPHDEFKFLIELRSLPSDKFYPVYTTLMQEELQNSLRANKFGMRLCEDANKFVSDKWVNNLWDKHNLYNITDFTENIYDNNNESHHFGVLNTPQGKRLTAGMHVHFSSRNAETGEVIDLPVKKIVRQMDKTFKHDIENSDRNFGEWEPKMHGFEYRSLPTDANVYKVLKKAFSVLKPFSIYKG